MRYAHAMPSFWIKESNAKLTAAPPNPLPANMNPLARPRLVLKYCDGTVEMTCIAFKVSFKRFNGQFLEQCVISKQDGEYYACTSSKW